MSPTHFMSPTRSAVNQRTHWHASKLLVAAGLMLTHTSDLAPCHLRLLSAQSSARHLQLAIISLSSQYHHHLNIITWLSPPQVGTSIDGWSQAPKLKNNNNWVKYDNAVVSRIQYNRRTSDPHQRRLMIGVQLTTVGLTTYLSHGGRYTCHRENGCAIN